MMKDNGHCEQSGKRNYTKKGAETSRNYRMQHGKGRRNRGRPEKLSIYQCDCNWWHLTSK